jgi:hypothetical protein
MLTRQTNTCTHRNCRHTSDNSRYRDDAQMLARLTKETMTRRKEISFFLSFSIV